jgi:hypothetical protein
MTHLDPESAWQACPSKLETCVHREASVKGQSCVGDLGGVGNLAVQISSSNSPGNIEDGLQRIGSLPM